MPALLGQEAWQIRECRSSQVQRCDLGRPAIVWIHHGHRNPHNSAIAAVAAALEPINDPVDATYAIKVQSLTDANESLVAAFAALTFPDNSDRAHKKLAAWGL